MGSIGSLLRGANIDSELKSSNEETDNVVSRLLRIVEIFCENYDACQDLAIYVSPANILQKNPYDIERMTVTLITAQAENTADMKQFFKELMEGEFDEFKDGTEVLWYPHYSKKKAGLLLYTKEQDKLDDWFELYELGFKLAVNFECCVSMPNKLDCEEVPTIFVHCPNSDKAIKLASFINHDTDFVGVEYMGPSTRLGSGKYFYVPVLSMETLGYNLPYTYINKAYYQSLLDSINSQDGV